MLRFDDVRLLRGGRAVLSSVSLTIHGGYKVGVTGRNGAGKTSFAELVTGGLEPDAGSVEIPVAYTIAYVTQELEAVERPALEHVLDGDRELRSLQGALREADGEGDGHRQAAIHARLEAVDAYGAPARAARIMAGLGFAAHQEQAPVSRFSGGWRMRLHLARALMCRSDVLVLDEPTNHLDLDAVIWLESWLRAYQGTLLLISHDREFLDPVVDHIAHVERGRVRLHAGNYSSFERRRSQELARARATYERQQREMAHMRAFVDRFRYKASKARQAQSRLKALARLELIAPAHVDSPFSLRFEAPRHLPTPLVRLESVSAGYGDHPVLREVSMSLAPGDRLALLGANGAGKSTLIKVLAGELSATGGARHGDSRLAVGYFSQHRVEQLVAGASPQEHLARLDPSAREQSLRDYLGAFGFGDQRAHEPVARLSGGEQARLALALIIHRQPNLLLLDEPTNHLDLEMRHALAVALQEFAGAVVIVSHDRFLLRTVSDSLWLVADGGARPYDGDLDDYARWLASRRRPAPSGQAAPADTGGRDARARRRAGAARRRAVQPLRQEVERLESDLARLVEERAVLAEALASPAIYGEDAKARLKATLLERGRVEGQLAETESAWLAASERLEAALAGGDQD